MARAAIFDLDGTLVTFNFDVRGSRKAMLEEIARRGFDFNGLSLSMATQEMLDTLRQQVLSGRSPESFESVRGALYSILDSFELESCRKSVPFKGTRETLDKLDSMSVRLSVVTNSGRLATTELLNRNNLSSYFEFVLTRDDVDAMKPNPDGLVKAIAMFSMAPASILCVGDSVFDIIAARKAGLKIASVATGLYTQEKLRSEGADYVLSSISEVPGVFAP